MFTQRDAVAKELRIPLLTQRPTPTYALVSMCMYVFKSICKQISHLPQRDSTTFALSSTSSSAKSPLKINQRRLSLISWRYPFEVAHHCQAQEDKHTHVHAYESTYTQQGRILAVTWNPTSWHFCTNFDVWRFVPSKGFSAKFFLHFVGYMLLPPNNRWTFMRSFICLLSEIHSEGWIFPGEGRTQL